ncbi:unnamed protein product [Parnassius mnemosyne]|uniref:Folded gastrulation N-terminal domain-containing protein n=1 Tax=Parnassius mnemosyne TaxID=213953 RepID=A0AAV1LPX7_9NEOP
MWYTWTALLLVSCALVEAAEVQAEVQGEVKPEVQVVTEIPGPAATTRAPPRTLDRQAAELAWRSWLQSPESGNPNAPPRRITTKSLFITPLVCPKGQRLDRNGCVQVVTVDKDEHERILLEHLNALFTSAPGGSDVQYDYGDEEPGPLQLSIPIGYDPQAAPLQSQDQTEKGQDLNYVKIDKKENTQNNDASIEAELELLKLQQSQDSNNTIGTKETNVVNNNALTNSLGYPEKPKRDSPMMHSSEIESLNSTEVGQKEEVFGHVSVDPVITSFQNQQSYQAEHENKNSNISSLTDKNPLNISNDAITMNNSDVADITPQIGSQVLQKESDNPKLNPEHDYSDIGEAIKLISRYAEVTTDDNFNKNKNSSSKDDSILGTRTKLQYRRNKPRPTDSVVAETAQTHEKVSSNKNPPTYDAKKNLFFRYSWPNQHLRPPQPNYPFKHLQDYWPGQKRNGGVYAMHGNPRRHHHTYSHNYFRPHGYPYSDYAQLSPRLQESYSGLYRYPHRVTRHNASPVRSHANNQDLYSLLGLRHWFSSEGITKR